MVSGNRHERAFRLTHKQFTHIGFSHPLGYVTIDNTFNVSVIIRCYNEVTQKVSPLVRKSNIDGTIPMGEGTADFQRSGT